MHISEDLDIYHQVVPGYDAQDYVWTCSP